MAIEFRSRIVQEAQEGSYNCDYLEVEKTCNAWAEEGFIVFSVQPMNKLQKYEKLIVRLTAKRDTESATTPTMKFEGD
jgi:hypothetical protein